MKKINDLILNVQEEGILSEKLGMGAGIKYIIATIDGVKYGSFFNNEQGESWFDSDVDQDLVEIGATLVELSPAKIKELKKCVKYDIRNKTRWFF